LRSRRQHPSYGEAQEVEDVVVREGRLDGTDIGQVEVR
jgi:hypothetical protein